MCVCLHVCARVCVRVCARARVCVCFTTEPLKQVLSVCKHLRVSVCASMCVSACVGIGVCACILCACACLGVDMRGSACVDVHAWMCMRGCCARDAKPAAARTKVHSCVRCHGKAAWHSAEQVALCDVCSPRKAASPAMHTPNGAWCM